MKRRNFLTLIGAVAAMPLVMVNAKPALPEPKHIHELYPVGNFPGGWTYVYAHTVEVVDYKTAKRIIHESDKDWGLNIHLLRRVEGIPDSFSLPKRGHWWLDSAEIVKAKNSDECTLTKRYVFEKWEAR